MRAGDYFPPPRTIIGRTGCCLVTNLPAIRKLLVVKVWRRSRLYRYACIMQRVIFSDRESAPTCDAHESQWIYHAKSKTEYRRVDDKLSSHGIVKAILTEITPEKA